MSPVDAAPCRHLAEQSRRGLVLGPRTCRGAAWPQSLTLRTRASLSLLSMSRPPGSSYFRYAESSMKNSFGLKYLHKFFNIPFLQLQVSSALPSQVLLGHRGGPSLARSLGLTWSAVTTETLVGRPWRPSGHLCKWALSGWLPLSLTASL